MSLFPRLHIFARPLLSSSLSAPSASVLMLLNPDGTDLWIWFDSSIELGNVPLMLLIQSINGGRQVMTRIGMNACSLSSAAEASDFECDVTHDDVKAADKDNALCLALSQLKIFGVRRARVISIGSLKLHLALGIRGLPKGRIVEIYGRDAAGKTTIALRIIKEAQKLGEFILHSYVSFKWQMCRLKALCIQKHPYELVNCHQLLLLILKTFLYISHPDCAENLLSMVVTLTKSGAVDVIVIDSVEGVMICAQVVKNKLAPAATKRAEQGIKFGRGFCHESDVLDLACEHGIIVKHEGSYFIEGSSLDSREAAELFLAQNDAVCDKLVRDMTRLYF
uniref:RecA-like N-terminal domain-containing protein n=1 Tax=Glycine max TaxID=3847 RepID=A0A0R0KIX0_SOYBN